jgi:hypothetical protein
MTGALLRRPPHATIFPGLVVVYSPDMTGKQRELPSIVGKLDLAGSVAPQQLTAIIGNMLE